MSSLKYTLILLLLSSCSIERNLVFHYSWSSPGQDYETFHFSAGSGNYLTIRDSCNSYKYGDSLKIINK